MEPRQRTDFAAPFTDDCEFIVFEGTHLTGRAQLAAFTQKIFDTEVKGTRLHGEVKWVSFVNPDLAVMHGTVGMSMGARPSPTRAATPCSSSSCAAAAGMWQVEACMNARRLPIEHQPLWDNYQSLAPRRSARWTSWPRRWPRDSARAARREHDAMFDHVIVGGGTAGCVLAARLSEDPATRVLLLEAGPPDRAKQIPIPAAFFTLFKGPYDWDYQTAPQEHAAAAASTGRAAAPWVAALINGMIYIRGHRVDYDGWRDAYGCAGGATTTCCPTSAGPRTTRAAPRPSTAPAARCGWRTSGTATRSDHAWVEAARAHGRLAANDDFNAARARWRRLPPGDPATRAPLVDGRRLPASGGEGANLSS